MASSQHYFGSEPAGVSLAWQAALNMRGTIEQQMRRAERAAWGWGVLLAVVSLAFGAITARPIQRTIGDPVVAYILGVLMHFGLGICLHRWKVGRSRKSLEAPVFGLLAILLIGGIFLIAFMRTELIQQLGIVENRYLAIALSLFVAVIEIVIPGALGINLASAWLDYAAKRGEYDYANTFARRMQTEPDPIAEWVHEAYSLKSDIARKEREIRELQQTILEHSTLERHNEAKHYAARVRTLENEIHQLKERLSLIERWYPGNPRELHDKSDELLAPKPPATDNYTPQSPPLSLEANEPQQLPPPQTEPTSPQGDEPDKKEPKP